MKVAILDDWFDTLRTLACFEKLAGHTVTVFTDHVQDTGLLAERLAGFDALALIRLPLQVPAPRPGQQVHGSIRRSLRRERHAIVKTPVRSPRAKLIRGVVRGNASPSVP